MSRVQLLVAAAVVLAACGSPATTGSGGSVPLPEVPSSEPAAAAPATSSPPPTGEANNGTQTSVAATVETDPAGVQACADVIDATAERAGDGGWRITATVRSGDTGWDKYADEWVVHGGGVLLGTRVLAHPHETEQPFTRSLDDVTIPDEVVELEVSARDSVNGYCGSTFVMQLDR